MSVQTFRMLGIVLGILLGTGAALTARYFRLSKVVSDSAENSKGAIGLEDASDPWDAKIEPPDPGRRRALAGLIESTKQQPNWLREFEFTDQSGRQVTSESLMGQPYVACFFFTTCKGSCPRQSSQMQLLHNKFKNKPIRFVSITVDPDEDTPEKLAEYAKSFQADPNRWFFLNAPLAYTERVGVEKFFLDGVEKRGHPDRFCLVNAEGNVVGSYVWLDIDERELLLKHIEELLGQ